MLSYYCRRFNRKLPTRQSSRQAIFSSTLGHTTSRGTPFPNLIRECSCDPTGRTQVSAPGRRHPQVQARRNYVSAVGTVTICFPVPLRRKRYHASLQFRRTRLGLANTARTKLGARSKFVIVRCAYAVYDEGGMLDVNVAGFPYYASTSPPPTTLPTPGLLLSDIGRKGSIAFAELRAIPTTAGGALLSAGGINAIVGWRNYATVHPYSTFPNFTFDLPTLVGGTGTRFVNYFAGSPPIGTTQDFRTVSTTTYLNRTDQAFITRAELIKLQAEAGFGAGAMQYLGTSPRRCSEWKAGTARQSPALLCRET